MGTNGRWNWCGMSRFGFDWDKLGAGLLRNVPVPPLLGQIEGGFAWNVPVPPSPGQIDEDIAPECPSWPSTGTNQKPLNIVVSHKYMKLYSVCVFLPFSVQNTSQNRWKCIQKRNEVNFSDVSDGKWLSKA